MDLRNIGTEIGEREWRDRKLNCNLMKGRKTGSGIEKEDNWPLTLQSFTQVDFCRKVQNKKEKMGKRIGMRRKLKQPILGEVSFESNYFY